MENELAAEVIRCPACGSASRPWITAKGFPIRACRACGMKFVYPLPSDVSGVYGADYFFGARAGFGYVNYDQDKQAMTPISKKYLALIAERRPARGRLLDVGAATGVFVALAQHAGWQAEGIEISSAAVAAAKAKGLPVTEATLESLDGESRYDAITFLDVLEHLPDPAQALRIAHRLLRPGGVIAVNVPDAGSLYARVMGRAWHAIVPPEHLSYFTFSSLDRLLADAGFQNVRGRTINKSFSAPYLAATCGRWLGWQWLIRAASALERSRIAKLALPVPLFDNLMVIGEKKPGV